MGNPVLSKKAKAAKQAETQRLNKAQGLHLMPGHQLRTAAVGALMKNRTIQNHVTPIVAKMLKPAYRSQQEHVAHYAAVRAALATLVETIHANRTAAVQLQQMRTKCTMLTVPINEQVLGRYMDKPTVYERTTVLRRESKASESAFVQFADSALCELAQVSAKVETWCTADATTFHH